MTLDQIMMTLNPGFMWMMSSMVIKLLVFVLALYGLFGLLFAVLKWLSAQRGERSRFLAAMVRFGPALSLLGVAYAGFAFVTVALPKPGDIAIWWPMANDALVSLAAGLCVAAVGIVGNLGRRPRRD